MSYRCCPGLYFLVFSLWAPAWGQSISQPNTYKQSAEPSNGKMKKVPSGVILVKGAWSSASDFVRPAPEAANVANGIFSDPYFGMTYALPTGWTERYKGPPPSETGRYVLAQFTPANPFKGPAPGSILITAQDMFFTALSVSAPAEFVRRAKDALGADYKIEKQPGQVMIGGRSFSFLAYRSEAAQLRWYVLATQIRCHIVEILLTSGETRLLDDLTLEIGRIKLPKEDSAIGGTGDGVPVCVSDYARDENVIARVNPIFIEHKFNSVPVRIIIGKEGKVRYIHFLSAFPDQARVITDSLRQWRFKPYKKNGRPVEVETGLLFGRGVTQ